MAALPVLKLFFLGVKQLSKPVAGFIKNRAKNSPQFKQHVLNAAQLWHRVNVRASQAASNASAEARALRIKPLDEATAVATFTDILGEGVIYLVAAVALVVEYQMSAEKDAKKAAALELRFKNAETALENQKKESDALRAELKSSQQNLVHVSQDLLELVQVCVFNLSLVFRNHYFSQGHSFNQEAILARRARLATYVSSIDGFAEDFAIRASSSNTSESVQAHLGDRWLKRVRSLLNATSADSASQHEKR